MDVDPVSRNDSAEGRPAMVLFRDCLGQVLRAARIQRGLTLRELSQRARVSLGYISEVERGHKEASSELLASLCEALDVPLSRVLREVSDGLATVEQPVLEPVGLPGESLSEAAGVTDVVASAA